MWVVRSTLSTELADGLAKALLRSAVKGDEPITPGQIRLDIDRLSVPLHPGAEAALAELRKEAGEPVPAPQPQPNATN